MTKETQKKILLFLLLAFVIATHLLPLLHNGLGLLAYAGDDCFCHEHSEENAPSLLLSEENNSHKTDSKHICAICAYVKTFQPLKNTIYAQYLPNFSKWTESYSYIQLLINSFKGNSPLPRGPPA